MVLFLVLGDRRAVIPRVPRIFIRVSEVLRDERRGFF
jgi:hypothetical protein